MRPPTELMMADLLSPQFTTVLLDIPPINTIQIRQWSILRVSRVLLDPKWWLTLPLVAI